MNNDSEKVVVYWLNDNDLHVEIGGQTEILNYQEAYEKYYENNASFREAYDQLMEHHSQDDLNMSNGNIDTSEIDQNGSSAVVDPVDEIHEMLQEVVVSDDPNALIDQPDSYPEDSDSMVKSK